MSFLTAQLTSSNSPLPAGELTPVPPPGADRELRLKFADFVSLFPKSVLNEDAVASDVDITFDLVDVLGLLTSGCSRVPIAWLRQRAPHCLGGSPSEDGFKTMLFPWQKIRSLLTAALRSGVASEAVSLSGLTPAGAKWLTSTYQQQRLDARRERASSPEEMNAPGPADNLLAVRATTQFPPLRPTAPLIKESARPVADKPVADRSIAARPVAAKPDLVSADLLRQRDVARDELARFQEETERRLVAIRAELKSMIDERDDALAAVTIFSNYENDRLSQLESENEEQAALLAQLAAELDALRGHHPAVELAAETPDPQLTHLAPDALPNPTSPIDTGADRTPEENISPATSPDSNHESSPRTRRRSGSSWRGWQVAALSALAALVGGAVVADWPTLSQFIPRATALAAEVQKLISDRTSASPTKASRNQTHRQAPATPRPLRTATR